MSQIPSAEEFWGAATKEAPAAGKAAIPSADEFWGGPEKPKAEKPPGLIKRGLAAVGSVLTNPSYAAAADGQRLADAKPDGQRLVSTKPDAKPDEPSAPTDWRGVDEVDAGGGTTPVFQSGQNPTAARGSVLDRPAVAAPPDRMPEEGMLTPEFVRGIRSEFGKIQPEKRFDELRKMASGNGVKAMAARIILRDAEAENMRADFARQERPGMVDGLERAMAAPRIPIKATPGNPPESTVNFPETGALTQWIQQRDAAGVASRHGAARAVADDQRSIDALTQRGQAVEDGSPLTLRQVWRDLQGGVEQVKGLATGVAAFGASVDWRAATETLADLDQIDAGQPPTRTVSAQMGPDGRPRQGDPNPVVRAYMGGDPAAKQKIRASLAHGLQRDQTFIAESVKAIQGYNAEQQRLSGKMPDFTDIRTATDFARWAVRNGVATAPTMAASMLGAVLGPAGLLATGGAMAVGDMTSARAEFAGKAFDPARFTSPDRYDDAAAARDGQVAQHLADNVGTTAALAVPYAALDFLGPAGTLAMGGAKGLAKQGAKAILTKGAKEVGKEAINEGGQEVINIGSDIAANERSATLTAADAKRVGNAAAVGGLMGGAGHAVNVGGDAARNAYNSPERLIAQAIDQAAAQFGLNTKAAATLREKTAGMEPEKAASYAEKVFAAAERAGLVKKPGGGSAVRQNAKDLAAKAAKDAEAQQGDASGDSVPAGAAASSDTGLADDMDAGAILGTQAEAPQATSGEAPTEGATDGPMTDEPAQPGVEAGAAPPIEGDLTTGDGQPYGTKASARARATRDGGDVVEVLGGWVVRQSQPSNTRGTNAGDINAVSGTGSGPRPGAGGNAQPGSADTSGSGGTVDVVQGELPQPGATGTAGAVVPGADAGGVPGATGSEPRSDALTAGQSVTIDGKPYTVKSAKPKVLVLTGADGKPRTITSDSATWAKVKPAEPNSVSDKPNSGTGPRILGKIGRTPNAAETVELRPNKDGTLTPHQGKYAMVDYETGEPVVIPGDSTNEQAIDAIKKSGAMGAKDKWFGVQKEQPDVVQGRAPVAQAQPDQEGAPAGGVEPAGAATAPAVPAAGSAEVEADGVKPRVRSFASSGYMLTMGDALAKVKELEADARKRKADAAKAPTAIMRGIEEDAASRAATLARKLREDIKQAVNSYPDARAEYAEARGEAQPASVAVEADGVKQPDRVKVMTRQGQNVYVERADLESDKPRMRHFTSTGKSLGLIVRENLDPTGELRRADAKEAAENPLFDAIGTKDGRVFASEAAAARELSQRGLKDTHEVAPEGNGFIVKRRAPAAPAVVPGTTSGAVEADGLKPRKTLQEARTDAALDKQVRENGEVLTRRQWVERKVAEGLKTKVTQEDRIKPMSRMAYFRANNEEQRAHDRKVKEAGKKDVFWIGDYEVTKTEHDYANALTDKAATPNAEAPVQAAPRGAEAGTAVSAPAAPAQDRTPEQEAFRNRIRSYWMEKVSPALVDYFQAYRAMGADRLERNRIKPEGISAAAWLEQKMGQQSSFDHGRKTGLTGIQALSVKDLWPTSDGAGERLRKAMLAAVKAIKAAPGSNGDWIARAEAGDYNVFDEPNTAAKPLTAKAQAVKDKLAPDLSTRAGMVKALKKLGYEAGDYKTQPKMQDKGEVVAMLPALPVPLRAVVALKGGQWRLDMIDTETPASVGQNEALFKFKADLADIIKRAEAKAPVDEMRKYIAVAADSIKDLRKPDVYRVLVESNPADMRQGIADYIKANRADLAQEVDSVLADAAADAERASRPAAPMVATHKDPGEPAEPAAAPTLPTPTLAERVKQRRGEKGAARDTLTATPLSGVELSSLAVASPPAPSRTARDGRMEQLDAEEMEAEEAREATIRRLTEQGVKPTRESVGQKRRPAEEGGGYVTQYQWRLKDGDDRYLELTDAERDRLLASPLARSTATHKDPGEPAEPVTPAVVREAIKTGVQDTGRKPSAMRAELLREIDRAVEEAPDYQDFQAVVKTMGLKDATAVFTDAKGTMGEKGAPAGYSRPKRTFKVEGDGVFTIQNSVRQLLTFRAKVESSPGFKDRQAQAGLNERATDTLDRRSADAAIGNMIEEGDFQAALDYAQAKGVDMANVKLTKVLRDRLDKWERDTKMAAAVAEFESRKPEEAAPLELAKDGIAGREVSWGTVPNGNDAFQYAIGKTEEDGREAIYRRRADERGSYGGWRWEADAPKGAQKPEPAKDLAGQKDIFSAPSEPEAKAPAARPTELIEQRKRLAVLEALRKCIS